MEKGITFLLVTVTIFVVIYFTYKIIKNFNSQKIIDELYASRRRDKIFVMRVLDAAYGRNKVIKNPTFPVRTRNGFAKSAKCDVIMVSRAGITVISILPCKGKLNNPLSEDWQVLDKYGNVFTYENPFSKNQYVIEVLKRILRNDGFINIAFHSLVILSDGSAVIPRYTYGDMCSEKNMLDEIRNINLDRQLKFAEVKDVTTTIKRSMIIAHRNKQLASAEEGQDKSK